MCIKIGLDVLWEEQAMLRIREAEVEDLPEMLAIYNYAIKNWTATFDLEEQTLHQRRKWFNQHGDKYPLIVAEVDGTVAGYCSLSPFKDKKAYEKTVEISIYLSKAYHGWYRQKTNGRDYLRGKTIKLPYDNCRDYRWE